jgi:N-acetylmuramoyl-L-alanine amidase-like protein
MALDVPGYGSVPIIWRPAVIGADASYGRNGKRILAIVHHRMVGTIEGTIPWFTQGDRNRPVSTHFGIGYIAEKLTIAQFVDLSDTAYGNGNYDSSGRWDDWGYPTTEINARTVSIEHEDNGTAGRGIVKPGIIAASIALDRLMLRGNLEALRAAGIRCRLRSTAAELGAITPSSKTIIRHWDIAGRLKPTCWTAWLDDPGMPVSRYVRELTGAAPAPAPVGDDDVKSFSVPKVPTEIGISSGGWLYVSSDVAANASNVQISPGRFLPLHGTLPGPVHIVEYVKADGTHTGKTYFVKAAHVTTQRPIPLTSPAPDPATLEAAKLEGRRAEFDRQQTGAKVALALPRP